MCYIHFNSKLQSYMDVNWDTDLGRESWNSRLVSVITFAPFHVVGQMRKQYITYLFNIDSSFVAFSECKLLIVCQHVCQEIYFTDSYYIYYKPMVAYRYHCCSCIRWGFQYIYSYWLVYTHDNYRDLLNHCTFIMILSVCIRFQIWMHRVQKRWKMTLTYLVQMSLELGQSIYY